MHREETGQEERKGTGLSHGKVCVALATYNGAAFLREQLDSVFAQSYSNLEVVAVDDASSDETVAILEEYAQKHRLRYEIQDANQGFIATFARVVSLCDGEFVALCDQDDIWEPDKIERLVEVIGDHDLAYSDAALVDGDGEPLESSLRDLHSLSFVAGRCWKSLLLYECVSGNTTLFRHSLVDEFLPFPRRLAYHDMWIAFTAACRGGITYVESQLVKYRRHGENITEQRAQQLQKKTLDAWCARRDGVIRKLIDYEAHPAISEEQHQFIAELRQQFERYDRVYFNWKLYRLLRRDRNDLYAVKRADDNLTFIRASATGLRWQRWKARAARVYRALRPSR